MPEIPVCQHCQRTVQMDTEDYVIPNKHTDDAEQWIYAHDTCHDEAMEQRDIEEMHKATA